MGFDIKSVQYTVEYRKTSDQGNADALSCLWLARLSFRWRGKQGECRLHLLQLNPGHTSVLRKGTAKDQVYCGTDDTGYTVETFKKIHDSLSVSNGCLL